MKHVAVHADDFGLSLGTNAAIDRLMRTGAIQSTTLMAMGPAFDDAIRRVLEAPGQWHVGLHANLTVGEPCGSGEGLAPALDERGQFTGRKQLWAACRKNQIIVEALREEIDAQWQRCETAGLRPTHIDSHQHAHALAPVHQAVWQVARARGVPVRVVRLATKLGGIGRRMKSRGLNLLARQGARAMNTAVPDHLELLSVFQAGGLPSVGVYQNLLANSTSRYIELMVHPAEVDTDHQSLTDISDVSSADYATLASEDWQAFLKTPGFAFMPTHELLAAAGVR